MLQDFHGTDPANRAAIGDEVGHSALERFTAFGVVAGALRVYRTLLKTVVKSEALARVPVPTLATGGKAAARTAVGKRLCPLWSDLPIELTEAGRLVREVRRKTLVVLLR